MSYEYKPITTLHTGSDELAHWGIKGQKWGVRRWQNEDGTLTPEGYIHYYGHKRPKRGAENQTTKKAADMTDEELGGTLLHLVLSNKVKSDDPYRKELYKELMDRNHKKHMEENMKHPYAKKELESIAKKLGKTVDTLATTDSYLGKPTKEEAGRDGTDIHKLLSNGGDPFMEKISAQEFSGLLEKYYYRYVSPDSPSQVIYDPNKTYWNDFLKDTTTDGSSIFSRFGDHSIRIERDPDTGKIIRWGLDG